MYVFSALVSLVYDLWVFFVTCGHLGVKFVVLRNVICNRRLVGSTRALMDRIIYVFE